MTHDLLDEKYEIIRPLGEGGMGSVLEARHVRIGRRVAIKLLRADLAVSHAAVRRFQQEARIAGTLGHEHIVDVTDLGTTPDGIPFLVMEYLEGQSLFALLSQARRLPVFRAVHITRQVLSALQAAHDAGVVHRDLKPDNVFLTRRHGDPDFVKLLDFGVAKLVGPEAGPESRITQSGVPVGTPAYMSPEQAAGSEHVSHRADIYAAGAILYQMVTGELPFRAPNYNALMVKILSETAPDPRELNGALPEQLASAIREAMARSPLDRFSTCNDFAARLAPFAEAALPGSTAVATALDEGANHDVFFLGLRPSDLAALDDDGLPLRGLALDTVRELFAQLERSLPHVVVSSVALDPAEILRRQQAFRGAAILVDLLATGEELSVYEWDAEAGKFAMARAPLVEMGDRISELCQARKRECDRRRQMSEVAVSAEVARGGQVYRIQTDVVLGADVQVRTRVWSPSALVRTVNKTLASADDVTVEHVQAVVDLQHTMATEETRLGKHI